MKKRAEAQVKERPVRDPRLFNEALDKAMRLLGVFRYEEPLTIAEAARQADITRSAAQRYVYTWRELSYLKKAPEGGGFLLAPRVLDIASRYLQTNKRLERAQPYLAECGRRTLETVIWGEMDDTDFVLLFRFPSPRPLNVYTPIGKRYPAYSVASGLAILAFMPPAVAADVLDRSKLVPFTDHTVTDRRKLDRVLETVRKTGYCITEQTYSRGAISISAPVFDSKNVPVAAVNISTFLARHSRQNAEAELAPVVVETAQVISGLLGNSTKQFNFLGDG